MCPNRVSTTQIQIEWLLIQKYCCGGVCSAVLFTVGLERLVWWPQAEKQNKTNESSLVYWLFQIHNPCYSSEPWAALYSSFFLNIYCFLSRGAAVPTLTGVNRQSDRDGQESCLDHHQLSKQVHMDCGQREFHEGIQKTSDILFTKQTRTMKSDRNTTKDHIFTFGSLKQASVCLSIENRLTSMLRQSSLKLSVMFS